MKVTPARTVAFEVLLRVLTRSAHAAEVLYSANSDFLKLSSVDRGLCLQIVMGLLRWQSALDKAISSAVGGEARAAKLDDEVRIALRMGVFQLGYLERIPANAAVNESVELVKRARKRSAVPLVNAVLRRLAKEKETLKPSAPADNSAAALSAAFAHPQWMVERWVQQFGSDRARSICEYGQKLPETHLRVSDSSLSFLELQEELEKEGEEVVPGRLIRNAAVVMSGDVTSSKAFQAGRIAIQDEGSQLVAALVGQGQRILDCCAAPGGKTAAMAERNPQSKIVAVELHEHRARKMRELVRAANVEIVTADARNLPLAKEERFDRVLVDVPCSGTGTQARNPEIKWRLKEAEFADLHNKQKEIFTAALARLSPGGRLVYATCSLEKEECEDVIHAVLKEGGDFTLLDCRRILQTLQEQKELVWREIDSLCHGPYLRTIPGVHPCDGFFAAVVERRA